MKRILIATPLKGDIPAAYFKASLQLATMNSKDYKFDWCLLDGPAVQQARDRKSTRLNSSHSQQSRMPSSA